MDRHFHSVHLFCRVVDNFGDISVCWRLARQLCSEYALDVALWVDDLESFHKICPDVEPRCDEQTVAGVIVKRWSDQFGMVAADEVANVVIEAFACELPAAYINAMAARKPQPVWINLEYLSAENWVEGCHTMASRHPSLPLTKYFFFPGFSEKTGGLLAERDLLQRAIAFQNDPQAIAAFFSELGIPAASQMQKISLFCYENAPVSALLNCLQASGTPTMCLVPEGVAKEAVGAFLQTSPHAGASATRGGLTVQVVPFMDQPQYDKLLWACDLNFVRGEDSFIRAQWAARPFVWQIYPQEEEAHWIKLNAFLARYTEHLPSDIKMSIVDAFHAWNEGENIDKSWQAIQAALSKWTLHANQWAQQLSKNGDLAANLVQYIKKIG
jgi:uncharacterized repeat protein (TIGR03837 family)